MSETDKAVRAGGLHVVLTQAERSLYRHIAQGLPVSKADLNLRHLLESGFVRPDRDSANGLRPVRPEHIGAQWTAQLERAIADIRTNLARLPAQIESLADDYLLFNPVQSNGVVEEITGVPNINARIDDMVRSAAKSMITAQPGPPQSKENIQISVKRDRAALERGVVFRTLYHDNARSGPATREWVEDMTRRGAHVRTLPGPFIRMVIVDTEWLVVSDHRDYNDPDPASAPRRALLVHHTGMAAAFTKVFDFDWAHADPWDVAPNADADITTTPKQRAIIRARLDGQESAPIAKSLGISERTLRNYMTGLREQLGFANEPQLIQWWISSPDRLIHD